MPFQTTGVNYNMPPTTPTYPAYPTYFPNYTQPTYPYSPTTCPPAQQLNQQLNVAPTTYGTNMSATLAPVRGRMVKSDTDISPSDVPMDGFASYFPAEDGSCIYVKHWDSNGKIQTMKFVPAPAEGSDFVPTASFEDEMRDWMSRIDKTLSQRNNYKPRYHKQNQQTQTEGGNDA